MFVAADPRRQHGGESQLLSAPDRHLAEADTRIKVLSRHFADLNSGSHVQLRYTAGCPGTRRCGSYQTASASPRGGSRGGPSRSPEYFEDSPGRASPSLPSLHHGGAQPQPPTAAARSGPHRLFFSGEKKKKKEIN